jgi:tetratricopeptide (TPR) repeat protein
MAAGAAWLVWGEGPRRARAFQKARQLLDEGTPDEALAVIRTLQKQQDLSPEWQDRLQHAEGDCLSARAEAALKDHRYEESLELFRAAAKLLEADAGIFRARVIGVMLEELARLFAAGVTAAHTQAVLHLIGRIRAVQPCPEAGFWQALCRVREGEIDAALTTLEYVHREGDRLFIDPPLYRGALLYRLGRHAEALRDLADANRIDPGCPLVSWLMGLALVGANADSAMAVRALQRALGPKGLPLWETTPARMWVEVFPEGRSYVRRLATQHRFLCPVFGSDLKMLLRQGQLALAQAQFRLGRFQDAADLYGRLLQECPPTVALLRGLGLSLARLEHHDQAFKHLKAALDLEPGHQLTAGYLALCGARGKPTQPEDKPKNVLWAVRQFARFDGLGDPEWARLNSAVFAEARALGLDLPREDLVRVCDLLASVQAHDVEAAQAYDHLAQTYPDALPAVCAWLYCRAAREHDFTGTCDRELFTRTFRDRGVAEKFFAGQGWDFAEVEYLFLCRSAQAEPGRFPAVLGADYAPRGAAFLSGRAAREEESGHLDEACRCVSVLVALDPGNGRACDDLARLHHRQGDNSSALDVLERWYEREPGNPLPLVRRAVLAHLQGQYDGALASIAQAYESCSAESRAGVAFLAARLVLAAPDAQGARAGDWLERCLEAEPNHAPALWMLAALRCTQQDWGALAELAPRMDRAEVTDARFHLLAAVCQLAAQDAPRALAAARRATSDSALAAEALYLLAWACLQANDGAGACQALLQVAASGSPSAGHARLFLGRLHFLHGEYEAAAAHWKGLDPAQRQQWQLDQALRQTVYLAGLRAFETGQFEPAAEYFREAGKLGLRERSLGPLIGLSLFRAGQEMLYQEEVRSQ